MAYYRKRKIFKRKTKGGFRRRRNYRRKRISRAPHSIAFAPLGTTQSVRMRYVEQQTINCGMGVTGDYVFAANGAYDPNVTGLGHSPYGFDQMMAMYDHATVVGSKITVRLVGAQAAVSPAMYMAIALRDSGGSMAGADPSAALEQSGIKFRLVSAMGYNAHTISRTFSMKKFFRGAKFGDDQYACTNASNPTDGAYFHVLLAPVDASDLATQPIQVTIDYYVVLSEPKMLPQS